MIKKMRLFTLVFICFFVPAICFGQKGGPSGPTDVIISKAVISEFADEIEALGTTKANESVNITADRSEKIVAIHFEDGQDVKKGDLLVTLDKSEEEAELRAAHAVTAETKNAYDRAQGLTGNSALPKAVLQERLAQLKQSRANADAIKASLGSYKIRAPFNGILGLRQVSVGTLVQPGDIITTIDDLSQIKVDFEVPSIYLAALKPGLPVIGHIEAFDNYAFRGEVKTVNTQVDPVTRTIKVRAVMSNENGLLKPGLLMNIELLKNPRQTLVIPEEALLKRSDKNFVYIAAQEDDKTIARQKEIKLGSRKAGTIEVLAGLNTGDQIITHGIVKLRDGAEINIRAQEVKDTSLEDLLKQSTTADKGTEK